LEQLRRRLPGLEIQVACDDVREGSPISRGRITAVLEETALDRAAIVYACGPPPMIEAVRQILKRRSFPMSQLLCEKFTG
jgi:NAD(P)H-flavin reductase